MSLRSEWQTAKGASVTAFQKFHAADLTNAHMEVPTPYPCKFNSDLGPTLDNLEKAQKAKKQPDITKYSTKAKSIVTAYKKHVEGASKTLGPDASKVLLAELADIAKHLP
jgi:hypothetical protein